MEWRKSMKIPTLCFILALAIGPSVCYGQWPLAREGLELKSSESGQNLTSGGRFQVFTSPQAKGSTFMIDSETGKIWIMIKDPSSGEFSLQRIPVADIDLKDKAKQDHK
jgi:hypothetical protein